MFDQCICDDNIIKLRTISIFQDGIPRSSVPGLLPPPGPFLFKRATYRESHVVVATARIVHEFTSTTCNKPLRHKGHGITGALRI